MLYLWSIHLSHSILPPSLICPFIPLIYHLFILKSFRPKSTRPKPFIVETIQSRIWAYLNTDLHRLTTIPTALINIHVLSSWSFQIPLVHSPYHYRNILSLNNQRQWGRKSTFFRNFLWLTLHFFLWVRPCKFHIANHTKDAIRRTFSCLLWCNL